jgi:hypothetical protein
MMRSFLKAVLAANLLACAVGAVAVNAAPASDFRARQREQIRFFQKLIQFGHPFQLKRPATAWKHAAPPATATTLSTTTTAAFAAATAAVTKPAAFAGTTTAVYFSAHPDDFALFTFPYRDVTADDTRVVFIFVTAGDAGLGAAPVGAPYYLARENGAIRAIRFMADASRPWAEAATTDVATVNGHKITRYSYRSTTAYFLRLPDGNGDGSGFPGTGNVSITALYRRDIGTLKAIDNSTSYRGWSDLQRTIDAIVATHADGAPNVWVNANDYDTDKNPGDHADHLITGVAALGVQKAFPCVNAAFHVGYATGGLANMNREDTLNKSGTFAVLASGMAERNYFTWDDSHKSWLTGLLARVALGNGQACAL